MTLTAFSEHLLFAFGLALLSALAVRAMIRWPILDIPNGRSAHAVATPRGGGVGVVVAFVTGMLVLYQVADFARLAEPQFLGVILAAIAIATIALIDDIRHLSARLRLLAQVAAALVAVGTGINLSRLGLPVVGVVELGAAGTLLTVFWIVGCTNAVNFMDGLDGLVGGTLLVVCIALAAIAEAEGGRFVYVAALFLAAGFAGFLPFNLYPARIFMGDVGSQFAGFVLAVLAVAAARFDANEVSFLIVPLLLFGLLFDAGFHPAAAWPHGRYGRRAAPHPSVPDGAAGGLGVRVVAAVHWGFAAFHALLAALFLHMAYWAKPLVVLPALAVQLAWMALVAARVRRAGLSWRG